MDRHTLDTLQQLSKPRLHLPGTVACSFGFLYILYRLLVYFDFPLLSPQEFVWNATVFLLPEQLLLTQSKREELRSTGMLSQTQAAKSEALRKAFGLSNGTKLLQSLPGRAITSRANELSRPQPTSDVPPGLGNWDNSCYQNSVLQGLASLRSLRTFLRNFYPAGESVQSTTGGSLFETVTNLSGSLNNGKKLWTPAKLKNMSSWQQQDAQEYFSKIMDELDKEAAKKLAGENKSGLEVIVKEEKLLDTPSTPISVSTDNERLSTTTLPLRNPMEGLLAQKVACTKCGISEGLSMIPFNCLTVPLGSSYTYDLEDCLDEYTKVEEITEVDCAKCTLLKWEARLEQMIQTIPGQQESVSAPQVDAKALSLPPELRAQVFRRLNSIQKALSDDDFSDRTLSEDCEIPKKGHVFSTKTRQAVVGRAPENLVIHINRSVFDEMTGLQRKNYASVQYPLTLDLRSWILDQAASQVSEEDVNSPREKATKSMLSDGLSDRSRCIFHLRAVVTHYGRHENGHYVCYRKHPVQSAQIIPTIDEEAGIDDDETDRTASMQGDETRWWRLSDEDVSRISEEDVLNQGGVFMLFYEREKPSTESELEETASLSAQDTAHTEALDDNIEEKEEIALRPLSASLPEVPQSAVSGLATPPPSLPDDELSSTPVHNHSSTKNSNWLTGTKSDHDFSANETNGATAAPTVAVTLPMRTSGNHQASHSAFHERDKGFGRPTFRPVAAT